MPRFPAWPNLLYTQVPALGWAHSWQRAPKCSVKCSVCSETLGASLFPSLKKYLALPLCQVYKIQWAKTAIVKPCNTSYKLECWHRGGSDQFFSSSLHILCSTNHTFKILIVCFQNYKDHSYSKMYKTKNDCFPYYTFCSSQAPSYDDGNVVSVLSNIAELIPWGYWALKRWLFKIEDLSMWNCPLKLTILCSIYDMEENFVPSRFCVI